MHRETRRVRTETKGIMQEIREHLESGEATGQVIALGYKPGTVYKVNQWLQREGTGRSGAAIAAHRQKTGDGTGPVLRGHVTLVPDGDSDVMTMYHFEPPVPCPGCGQPVVHWEMCSLCGVLFPAGCACPEGSPDKVHGYRFQELRESLTAQ